MDGHVAHAGHRIVGGRRAGRLLDDLLMAALDRAISLEQVDDLAVPIAEHLDLHVPRLDDGLLQVDRAIAKGLLGFALGPLVGVGEIRLLGDQAHPFAARHQRPP